MTNITKAAQDALEAMERYQVKRQDFERFADEIADLRAALQDKAGEVRQFRRVGCADWYDGNPDHEDGRGPYEARTLYAAQPAPVVPEMSGIAIRKLGGLQERGWQINGYAIRRGNERGLIDSSGFVGWWRSEGATVAPDDVALRSRVQDLLHLLSFAKIETPTPTDKPEAEKAMADIRAMIADSQQKGGE